MSSFFYLPIISLADFSIKEARGASTKGFDYQEFTLADSARVLLENQASYTILHHVGEFMILKKINYSDWLKEPIAYALLNNPDGLTYSWHIQDWTGWGHKAYGKESLYEIVPVNINNQKVSIDIQTNNNRVVLMFQNPGWIVVDPLIHDAIRALEY